jgi:hypothetical protein
MSFVSFWTMKFMAELTDRPSLTTEWEGQNICFKRYTKPIRVLFRFARHRHRGMTRSQLEVTVAKN